MELEYFEGVRIPGRGRGIKVLTRGGLGRRKVVREPEMRNMGALEM